MAKFHHSNLFKPTPEKFRRLGAGLVDASTGIAVPAIFAEHQYLAAGVLIAGWIGKLLVNFFGPEDTPPTTHQ